MTKIERIDDKRAGDRLTAQLALAAAESAESKGGCLNTEQLADVAAGCCSDEERKSALEHFSSCQQCYDAWLAVSLSLAAMESGTQKGKTSGTRIRNLGYLGSALAIAASVVVFLNVQESAITPSTVQPLSENRAKVLKQMELVVGKEVALEEEKIEEAVVDAVSGGPSAPAKKKDDVPVVARSKMQMKAGTVKGTLSSGGSEYGANLSSPKEMAAPSSQPYEMEADVDLADETRTLTEWLQDLESVCKDWDKKGDIEKLTLLKEQGRRIDEFASSNRLKALREIVYEEGEVGAENDQCRRILQLLAQEDNTE